MGLLRLQLNLDEQEERKMKVLMINGSPRANGNTAAALKEMAAIFALDGIEAEIIHIGNQDIRGCVACGGCRSGKCVIDDAVNAVASKFETADGIVVGSPVYYAMANATVICGCMSVGNPG